MDYKDIIKEIRTGINLDIHVKNEDKMVRRAIADNGYKLDILMNDPSHIVRAAVARKGYRLDVLRNDSNEWVKLAVYEVLDARSKRYNGYDIIGRTDFDNEHYALGHNAKTGEYATWSYEPVDGSYSAGHYFLDKDSATVDLFKRASERIELTEQSLGLSLLTHGDRSLLREENAREDIEYALENFSDSREFDIDISKLLENKEFFARALHAYYNIDHSAENEALEESMSMVYRDYIGSRLSQIEQKELNLALAPEIVSLLNDLLSMSFDELTEKYGPLGDGIEYFFKLGADLNGYLVLKENELDDEAAYKICFEIRDENNFCLGSAELPENTFITGEHVFELNKLEFSVSVKEDESLRRVGNEFVFKSLSSEDRYTSHNGEVCSIQRGLTGKEADLLLTGLMWEARFPNGDVMHIFDDELEFPAAQKEKGKIPLDKQIELAKDKTSGEGKETNSPELDR